MTLGETANASFGDVPTVGHRLRKAFPARWLRVHSLPQSKRYAETDAEFDGLLRRHNELALEIVGAHERATLFLHVWGVSASFVDAFLGFDWADRLDLSCANPTLYPSADPDDPDLLVAGFPILWSPGSWDSLLRDVANDRLPSVVIVNPRTGEAYAPYDGGADLFLANPERVATLANRWSSWLSRRQDGL